MNYEDRLEILKEIEWKPDIYATLEKLGCKYGIEVGVREGNNLNNLAKNFKFAEGKLYGLDCWTEDPDRPEINDMGYSQPVLDGIYQRCVNRFSHLPYVEIVRDFSVSGAKRFEDEYFDFVYIDAAHDYDSVVNDLNAWWPKVKRGGIFSGHDYFPDRRVWRGKECGVFQAVNEFVAEKGVEVDHTTDTYKEGGPGVACNSFFIIKR